MKFFCNRKLLSIIYLGAICLVSVISLKADESQQTSKHKIMEGTQPLSRATLGLHITNARLSIVNVEIIINNNDVLRIKIDPKSTCYIYSFAKPLAEKQIIQYNYRSQSGISNGGNPHAYLVFNDLDHNPMTWSGQTFNLPEAQRSEMFSKDFRFDSIQSIDIEEIK